MDQNIITPLGEIQVYIDDVRYAYAAEPYLCGVQSVIDHPVEGCYRLLICAKDWQRIRCVVVPENKEISNSGSSGERYLYAEFIKDNVVLTIGAGDEQAAFDTHRLRYGVEYVRNTPVDTVMFGIAWATDYEGPYDIRTQLAADLY